MDKYHVAILKNETDSGHLMWVEACKTKGLNYSIINLIKDSWIEQITNNNFDLFLATPSSIQSKFKKLYDERLYILDKIMKLYVYPNFDEVSIHENKRYLSFWLMANKLPHPKTHIFYDKKESYGFINNHIFPIVGKFNIGASGKGVKIIKSLSEAKKYIDAAFGTNGLRQNYGPNLKMGSYKSRIISIIKNPSKIIRLFNKYKTLYNETQKGFIILQEYVKHEFEWRVVKIGNSYFGHQKVKQGDKASGTKGIDYIEPPEKLLNFVKNICEKYGFNSMAIDLFEDGQGGYLINEMQTIFGHVQAYICEKKGVPGRFLYQDNTWIFEEGMFNINLSYNLRLENAIDLFLRK